jgi:hypothetical protein
VNAVWLVTQSDNPRYAGNSVSAVLVVAAVMWLEKIVMKFFIICSLCHILGQTYEGE